MDENFRDISSIGVNSSTNDVSVHETIPKQSVVYTTDRVPLKSNPTVMVVDKIQDIFRVDKKTGLDAYIGVQCGLLTLIIVFAAILVLRFSKTTLGKWGLFAILIICLVGGVGMINRGNKLLYSGIGIKNPGKAIEAMLKDTEFAAFFGTGCGGLAALFIGWILSLVPENKIRDAKAIHDQLAFFDDLLGGIKLRGE